MSDRPSDAVPEQHRFGKKIGGVQAADPEGNDGVEGGGGTDVDQADDTGDEGHDKYGIHWDSGSGLQL